MDLVVQPKSLGGQTQDRKGSGEKNRTKVIMGALVPLMFFFVFVLGIAQSSITIKTYADAKKAQDTSYNFSIFTLAFSLIGMLISGGMIFSAIKGPAAAPDAVPAAAANNSKLVAKLENLAEQIKQKAN
jgi:hypothetical protein